MKTLYFSIAVSILVLFGLSCRFYLGAKSNLGEPLSCPSVLDLGELVFEPVINFEIPVGNRSGEAVQLHASSDCSCVRIGNPFVVLDSGTTVVLNGEAHLIKVRDEANLRWQLVREILLDARPFSISQKVALRASVIEPIRLGDVSPSVLIDPEVVDTFSCEFDCQICPDIEIIGISAPGFEAVLVGPRTLDTEDSIQPCRLRVRALDPMNLSVRSTVGFNVAADAHGKKISQKLPITVEVLQPLRINTTSRALGVLRPGKHQIKLPYRFATGTTGTVQLTEISLENESIEAADTDKCIIVTFTAVECPPNNLRLRIPYNYRSATHSDIVYDELQIPVSYSCF